MEKSTGIKEVQWYKKRVQRQTSPYFICTCKGLRRELFPLKPQQEDTTWIEYKKGNVKMFQTTVKGPRILLQSISWISTCTIIVLILNRVSCGDALSSFIWLTPPNPKGFFFTMACAEMTQIWLLWDHRAARMTMGLQIPLGLPTVLHAWARKLCAVNLPLR